MAGEVTDVRWQQRLENFERALGQLKEGLDIQASRPLSRMETQGLIKAFEFCHELAWNVMKDFFADQGNTSISGSRDAFREAYSKGLIGNGDLWMETIRSRNLTTHTYNEGVALQICEKIPVYYGLFEAFLVTMKGKIPSS
jgi:nucleotidyltransferase substrate binding protein (TIGR01987 family)